jgi:hypothetical protein
VQGKKSRDSKIRHYNKNANFDYVVQDMIPYQTKLVFFYVRYPNQKTGKITGIVSKSFDRRRRRTINYRGFYSNNPLRVQLGPLQKEYGAKLSTVFASGEKIGALW